MKYNPSKRIFFLTITASVLSFIAFVIFLWFIFSKIEKVGLVTEENIQHASDSEQALSIKKQLIEIAPSKKTLYSFFVNQGEEAYFLERVESVARLNGVKVSTESVLERPPLENGFIPLSATVKFEGSWMACLSFLAALENMPQAVHVEATTMNLVSGGNIWTGNVVVSVYKLP